MAVARALAFWKRIRRNSLGKMWLTARAGESKMSPWKEYGPALTLMINLGIAGKNYPVGKEIGRCKHQWALFLSPYPYLTSYKAKWLIDLAWGCFGGCSLLLFYSSLSRWDSLQILLCLDSAFSFCAVNGHWALEISCGKHPWRPGVRTEQRHSSELSWWVFSSLALASFRELTLFQTAQSFLIVHLAFLKEET